MNNECDTRYEHPVLQPQRVHELIERVKARSGGRLLVSTSYRGRGRVPDDGVMRAADFILLHGNGTVDPALIADQVDRTRLLPGYRGQPIVFNEDDHFDFDRPANNFIAALDATRVLGLLRPRRRCRRSRSAGRLRQRLPARPRQLADQHRPQAGLLHPASRNHRGHLTGPTCRWTWPEKALKSANRPRENAAGCYRRAVSSDAVTDARLMTGGR